MAEESSLHSPITPLPPPALQPTPPAKKAFFFNFISVAAEKEPGTAGRHKGLRGPTVPEPALRGRRGQPPARPRAQQCWP